MMKVEFAFDAYAASALQDFVDALMIARLKQTISDTKKYNTKHPEDRKYNEQYVEAATFVLEHFGGHP